MSLERNRMSKGRMMTGFLRKNLYGLRKMTGIICTKNQWNNNAKRYSFADYKYQYVRYDGE